MPLMICSSALPFWKVRAHLRTVWSKGPEAPGKGIPKKDAR